MEELQGQKIIPVEIVDEMQKSYLDYSMSVIVSRALPDVRDGLKPVHRRILYTMYENSLTPDKPYRKCADTVGSVLGRYHPHGDLSVYDALVRMAQDFSLRYMLVDGHGNFGSIDGFPAAAYRYTEARLSKIAVEMLTDIEKDTVNFSSNYDDRLKEPDVLPARFPQLLVNGSSGIAVGMATNIPPHNLGEVITGMCELIDNPDMSIDELNNYIKGPDFPTGAIIMGRAGIRAAYSTGRGHITVRARTEIEETKSGRYRIVITEIPYGVNKQNLVKGINTLVTEKRIEGIDYVVDFSNREGIRIVVELKRDANPQIILNQLFTYTQLQTTFGVIMLALVDGQPKILNLKEMLQHYIDHQCEIVERRTRYDLRKAEEREHILEGLKIALDFIDEVISILRAAKNVTEGKEQLMERFGLDDVQATAIVQMRLGQLTGLERTKIEEELAELVEKIAEYKAILSEHGRVLTIVKEEALRLYDNYKDERRTEITAVSGEVDIEDLIPLEKTILTLTDKGYIKRIGADVYRTQRRGGRGITGMSTREEDFAEYMLACMSHDNIMFFTNTGRLFRLKAYEVPEGSRTSKGMNIINILQLEPDEKITAMLKSDDDSEGKYLCMVTRKGIIKRTVLSAYDNVRKSGLIAINIDDDDELCWVALTNGESELIIGTRDGMAIRFDENDARPLGRTARGVKSITLKDGDCVVGMAVVTDDADLLTVTETGFGRRSPFDDYRLQFRGGKGILNYRTERFGRVAAIASAGQNDDVIMISQSGVLIRVPVCEISTFARPAKGVRVMRVGEGDAIVTLSVVPHSDEEDDEQEFSGGESADVSPENDKEQE